MAIIVLPNVNDIVPVRFNGRPYTGVVIAVSPTRAQVRFTTGTGRTRETWFKGKDLEHWQVEPADRPQE